MLVCAVQLSGEQHDVNGLYALLKTSFSGVLYADNGYWPNPEKREELLAHGITVCAVPKKNAKLPLAPSLNKYLRKQRGKVERFIALFDEQFHASQTLNRSERHYSARRIFKLLAHNCSRLANAALHRPIHSVAHFNAAA